MKNKRVILGACVGAVVGASLSYAWWTNKLMNLNAYAELSKDHIDWLTDQVILSADDFPQEFVDEYRERLAYLILIEEAIVSEDGKNPRGKFWIKNFIRE